MDVLNDTKAIKKLDTSFCYESILALPDQCSQAWDSAYNMEFPYAYSNAASLLFCGMGGSAYGSRIIKSLYKDDLTMPLDLVCDYTLPKFVNRDTLMIMSSYSGNTEETLYCAHEAVEKPFDTKVIGVTSGGALAEKLRAYFKPIFTFTAKYNPSGQPRLGQGYMQMGQIGILSRLGFLPTGGKDIEKVLSTLRTRNESLALDIKTRDNLAKTLAYECQDKVVILLGAEFLEGAIHSIRNPFHESAKHFADYFLVPELNHHLMEGLTFPKSNKNTLLFYLIESDLYTDPIKKRMQLTADVIEKNSIAVKKVKLLSGSKLEQVFELIQLGSFISFYLAILHGIDPAKVPWVDYFKDKLKGDGRN